MSITSITRDWGIDPCIVRISTTDDLATVSATGYLLTQQTAIRVLNNGDFDWSTTDYVLVNYSDNGGSWGFFSYVPSTQSLVPAPSAPITIPVPIADGGTGATNAAGARTNLGLGSMSTQDASSVAISGGTIDGVALGSSVTGLPVPSGLNATGTPDNTTFLRGDGQWATPAGGGTVTEAQVQQSAFNIGVDSGTSTAYSVALTPPISSYTNGLLVTFTAANPNSDISCTLDVDGMGAVGIVLNIGFSFLSLGDINPNVPAQLMYSDNLGQFILLNPQVSQPVLRDMMTGNGYWIGVDQGISANTYGLNLAANVASGGVQATPLFAVLTGANATNTGASTLTFSNGGPFGIVDAHGDPLTAGAIVSGKSYFMVFDGSANYFLMNSSL